MHNTTTSDIAMQVAKSCFARRLFARRAVGILRFGGLTAAMALTLTACSESSTFYAMQTPPKVEGKVRHRLRRT